MNMNYTLEQLENLQRQVEYDINIAALLKRNKKEKHLIEQVKYINNIINDINN